MFYYLQTDESYVADPNFQRTTNKYHQKINKQTDKNTVNVLIQVSGFCVLKCNLECTTVQAAQGTLVTNCFHWFRVTVQALNGSNNHFYEKFLINGLHFLDSLIVLKPLLLCEWLFFCGIQKFGDVHDIFTSARDFSQTVHKLPEKINIVIRL